MKFPTLKYMTTHGIYSVRELYAARGVVNPVLHKECSICAYVHDEECCKNCNLKK